MQFFFLPEKKKILPEKNLILCPRSFETVREKISKTAGEEKNVPEKKLQNSARKKKRGCPRKKCKIFPVKMQKIPESLPEKKIFNPRKILKFCPRKLQNARENLEKSRREKYFLHEKKTKKSVKNAFSGTFHFLR